MTKEQRAIQKAEVNMMGAVIGPRGGLSNEDISCDSCICANKCAFSGPKTRPWGCHDWVSADGRRVATEAMPPEDIEGAQALQREFNLLQGMRIDRLLGPAQPEGVRDGEPKS